MATYPYVLRINGVVIDQDAHPIERLRITEVMNGINRLDFDIPIDNALAIELGQEVEVDEDGGLVYGGYIDEIRERTINWKGANAFTITSTDFSAIGQFRLVNLTLAAGTLKAQLLQLETPYLDDYGASVAAGQVDGPAMAETPIVDLYLRDVLNLLAKNAPGYAWSFSYDKELSMALTSSAAAPFAITPANVATKVLGDITVQRKRNENCANRVIVRSPPITRLEYNETFVADGSEDTFTATGRVLRTYGYVHNGDDPSNPGQPLYETMAIAPETDATWQFDPATNSITRLAGPPTAANDVIFKYDGEFTEEATAEDVGAQAPPTGIREVLLLAPAGISADAIQSLAEGELAARMQDVVKVSYKTNEIGIRPGMTQAIEETFHGIDSDFLITEVELADEKLGQLTRNVQATEATRFQGSFRDKYTLWAKTNAGAATVESTGAQGGGPAPPDRAVQFNRSGAFGGSDELLHDYDAGGDTFGNEDLPALLAVRTDEARLAQAWVNKTAGDALAMTLWVLDDGTAYWESGAPFVTVAVDPGSWNVHAGGIVLTPRLHASQSVLSAGLLESYGLALYNQRITTTTFTIDSNTADPARSVYVFDPTNHCTVTLPPIASYPAAPHTDINRLLWIVNDSPTYSLILDPNSSELIFTNGVGRSTLLVGPGASVCLSLRAGTDAGWKILSSHGLGVQSVSVTLTDAQVKALPTTAITLVPAPPTGYRIKPISATFSSDFSTAAYTNINATYAACAIHWLGDFSQWAQTGIVDDATYATATRFTAFFGTTGDNTVDTMPYHDTPSDGAVGLLWVQPPVIGHGLTNGIALAVKMDNNGSGNLTGGNAANSLKITVHYELESIA